ncbi:sulfurtransferase complex subunit TusC [Vibrio vulnificus]|uniref:sulfurtransferase complex subunit TusC n=1 Tax=Vibrio vulnificus TaxID=672 RepID=UPI00102358C8|nr:sulfurtransferase complex subunit TusC [Vibrio vulnificus]RZQ30001.1 sulfurtransferase complex subunit TusC [Vibrio vulnificus]
MSQLTYLFRTSPHSSSSGREGVDALLAASAYCEAISVVFIGDGVYQLLAGQQTASILCKDYAPMFKLFDLYDIEHVYVCQQSLQQRGLTSEDLLIEVEVVDTARLQGVLHNSVQLLSF